MGVHSSTVDPESSCGSELSVQYPPVDVLETSPQPAEGVQLDVVDVVVVPPLDVVVVVVVQPDEELDVVEVDVVVLEPELEDELELDVEELEPEPDPLPLDEEKQPLVAALCIEHSTSDPDPPELGISSHISDALSVPTFT